MPRLPISVLLLARDETRALERLLPALVFVAEVVVVRDPRGDPALAETASRLGARVVSHEFVGFGPQRQFALGQCREEWVLWLDADEQLAPGAEAALRAALGGGARAFALLRRGWFLGKRIRGCGWQDEWIVRVFRREGARFDDAPVHERLVAGAQHAVRLPGAEIDHHSYPDWDACVDKLIRYARAGAEKSWRDGRRASALDVLFRPPLRFLRMFVLQAGIRDGGHGLVLCALAAAQVALKYGDLWSRTRAARRS
jgi:glycosyltransferase involved in cell wall biosynthesis